MIDAPPDPEDALRQYVIYWNPSDYPWRLVVRGWSLFNPTQVAEAVRPDPVPLWISSPMDSMEKHGVMMARQIIQTVAPGSVPVSPSDGDDATIVEIWL